MSFFCFTLVFSQNTTKIWQFQNNARLNFIPVSPSISISGQLTGTTGCSSIADNSSNLLFYTDGATVYNQNHTIMPNGTGLFGTNAAQPAIILKQPGNNTIYYIFTVQGGGSSGLRYSVVDMSLAAGTGSVINKNISVKTGVLAEKLTATKHCNGVDYWIVVKDTAFYAFELTSVGINTVAVVSNINIWPSNGCMKLSPNGRKLGYVGTSYNGLVYNHNIFLLDFNNSSGAVSNPLLVQSVNNFPFAPPHAYGGEFSPDGTKFYFAGQSGMMHQVELCNYTNSLSAAGINTVGTGEFFAADWSAKGSFQLGTDGKIYIAKPNSPNLGVISQPNLSGNYCAYNATAVALANYTCQWGLPNFPGSYFEKTPFASFSYSSGPNNCKLVTFSSPQICAQTGYSVLGYQWDFGDPSSGILNSSYLSSPSHQYSSNGTYQVKLIRAFNCKTDTITQIVNITSPTLSVLSPSLGCGTNTAIAIVNGGTGPYSYSWSPNISNSATANIQISGTYTVTVFDQGGGCTATTSAALSQAAINGTLNVDHPKCFGLSNGSASFQATPANPSYSYSWTNSASTSSVVSGLSAGVYTLTLYDPIHLCTLNYSFTLNQPTAINIQISASNNSVCTGQQVILSSSVTGGSPGYQYNWSSGPNTITNTFVPNTQGIHTTTLTIVDSNSCIAQHTYDVFVTATPTLSVNGTSLCLGMSTTLSASGASVYVWTPGNLNGGTISVSPIANVIYTLTGYNLSCISSSTVMVQVHPLPSATVSNNSPICEGQGLLLNASPGFSYLWSGPVAFASTLQNPIVGNTSTLQSGVYTLNITDVNTCSISLVSNVTIHQNPIISVTGNTQICVGAQSTLTANGASSYTWSNGFIGATILITPYSPTNYTVTGYNSINQCQNNATVTLILMDCVSIPEKSYSLSNIRVFPNPNNGQFTIETQNPLQISLHNSLGQEIMSSFLEEGSNLLDFSEQAKGLYFFVWKSKKDTGVIKIVKQ